MRDRPPRQNSNAQRLDWPGGVVPEWAKPNQGNAGGGGGGKRRRGGKGKGKGGGHERQGGSSPSKRERLQKIMAQSGHGSRRNIEILIAQGHITINGQIAKLGDLVGPGDKVKMDGEFITLRFGDPPPRVLLYHKPEGEIVTRDDPEGRATVFEKLPRVHNGRWVSVGRLDLNTGGLLIFTTSGELANRLTHPRFEVEREYAVRLMGELTDEIRHKLLVEGVDIEGENCKFDMIEDRGGSDEGSNHWYHVVLREGKNREVRRMFEAVSLMVSRLMRVRFGPVTLPTFLKRGMMKEMEEGEALQLMEFCGLKQDASAPMMSAPAASEPMSEAPSHASSAPVSEDDYELQPPGISHEAPGVHSSIANLGGGGKRQRGPRPQGQGQGHGQGHRKHGGQGQGQPGNGPNAQKKFGKNKRKGKGGQGQGQGPGPQGGHGGQGGQGQGGQGGQRHGRGQRGGQGGGQGGGARDGLEPGNRALPNTGRRDIADDAGNQGPPPAPAVDREHLRAYVSGHEVPMAQERPFQPDRRPGSGQKQGGPRGGGKRGGGGQRGDEQPKFKEPQENQRGDEQPLTNENRRIW